VVRDRSAAQKHVWRAAIILLSADGVGTHEIMRRTGKSKTCVWRWQERFMEEGVDGLLRDKTRPSRIPPLGSEVAERVVALTLTDPPVEATHWTASMMAAVTGISESAVRRIWRSHGCSRTAIGSSSSRTILTSSVNCAMSLGFTSILQPMPSFCPSMRKARSRHWTAPSRGCP
jgi:transposase